MLHIEFHEILIKIAKMKSLFFIRFDWIYQVMKKLFRTVSCEEFCDFCVLPDFGGSA